MIGLVGQYIFKFSVGGLTDFLSEEELISFTLIEKAGNVLPEFELSFVTSNEEIFSHLHEGNTLSVSFGKTKDDMVTAILRPANMDCTRRGQNQRIVTVQGLYNALGYLSSSRLFISDKKSGVEVMNDIVSKYFTPQFNVEKSKDTQRWVSPNRSDKKYVNELWMHSDFGESFPAVGITSDGVFILKDIMKDLKTPYDWRLVTSAKDDKDLLYHGDPMISVKTGFVNSFVGYGREKVVYNLETGDESAVLERAIPTVAITEHLSKSSDVEKKFAGTGMINDNVHSNYWISYQRNFSQLASFANVTATFVSYGEFSKVRVLDKVMYKDEQGRSSAEFNSGLYYVSKVARSISGRQFSTTIALSRESFNKVESV